MFIPGCPPCCCYETMIVICIYDESDSVYTPSTVQYDADVLQWENFIDGILNSKIRLGVLRPIPNPSYPPIKPASRPYPKDTDRPVIDVNELIAHSPRVTRTDIIDFFDLIRTSPDPLGAPDGPELLLFCLDNSGSITVGEYATELAAAKVTIQDAYPDLEILDDVSSSGEQWVRDAYNGAFDRTCG